MLHSLSRLALQALSLLFLCVALASNYTQATAGLAPQTFDWYAVVASLVALELGAVAAGFAFWPMMRRWHAVGAVTAAALLTLCLSVSIPNAMGFTWAKHESAVAAADKASSTYNAASADVVKLRAQLAGYSTVRPTKDLSRAYDRCDSSKCRKAVQAEQNRASERDGIMATLDAAQSKALTAPVGATGTPFANLASKLSGEQPETWSLRQSIAYVLFLQLSAPLTALLAGCVGVPVSTARRVQTLCAVTAQGVQNSVLPQETQPCTPVPAHIEKASTQRPHTEDAHVAHTNENAHTADDLTGVPAHLLKLVVDAGGRLDTSTRKLSDRLGVPHSKVRAAISAAITAGVIVAHATKNGTTLAIA